MKAIALIYLWWKLLLWFIFVSDHIFGIVCFVTFSMCILPCYWINSPILGHSFNIVLFNSHNWPGRQFWNPLALNFHLIEKEEAYWNLKYLISVSMQHSLTWWCPPMHNIPLFSPILFCHAPFIYWVFLMCKQTVVSNSPLYNQL